MTDDRHKINKYIISRISKVTSSMEKLKNRDRVGVERWRDSSDGLEDTAEKTGEEPANQGRNAVAGGTEVEMQDNYGSSIV